MIFFFDFILMVIVTDETPRGIVHYTLWSIYELTHDEVECYVSHWLASHFPSVCRWDYDDNSGERSINLFHVHVFFELEPYSYIPPDDRKLYQPSHPPIGRRNRRQHRRCTGTSRSKSRDRYAKDR